MSDWNSEQYLKFEGERTQPAVDLAARITAVRPEKIVDIGCGPGNSTKVIAQRYPDAYILGCDNSGSMLDAARKAHPGIDFTLCDARSDLDTLGNDFDLVFSNACIQWIPDHPRLLRNMMGLLKKGGAMAVQMPVNYREPIHMIIDEIAGQGYFIILRRMNILISCPKYPPDFQCGKRRIIMRWRPMSRFSNGTGVRV